jgi:hypothetical protein
MLYNEIGKFVKLLFGLFHKFFGRSLIFAGIAVINLLSALGCCVLPESYICEYCSSEINNCPALYFYQSLIFANIAAVKLLVPCAINFFTGV